MRDLRWVPRPRLNQRPWRAAFLPPSYRDKSHARQSIPITTEYQNVCVVVRWVRLVSICPCLNFVAVSIPNCSDGAVPVLAAAESSSKNSLIFIAMVSWNSFILNISIKLTFIKFLHFKNSNNWDQVENEFLLESKFF